MKTILQLSICLFLLFASISNAHDIRTFSKKNQNPLPKEPQMTFKNFYKDFGVTKKKNRNSFEHFIQKAPPPKNITYGMPKYTPKKNYDYKMQYHIPKGINKIPKIRWYQIK